MTGPLDGLLVVETGSLIAGPFCGQLLGDLGAEVIKIEPPGKGDPMRQWGRVTRNGRSYWWAMIARNKKSVTLDLRQAEGQDIARSLISKADFLIENFRPGTMERWGLGYDRLREENPGLIMVRISGYGQTGPYAKRAGFGGIGEAMGGLRRIIGEPDRPPARAGISIGDSLAATYGALGALAALHAREATGLGQVVDSAIYESVLAMTESLVPEYHGEGYVRERSGAILPGVAPSNVFTCADGDDILIGANQDTVFRRLAELMDRPELADDPRFNNHRARGENQAELDSIISDWTRLRPSQHLLELLAEAGVPAGRIYQPSDMMEDPHFVARNALIDVQTPGLGEVRMPNVTPRLMATPGRVRSAAPDLGANNDDILCGMLGLDSDLLDKLKERGIV